MDKAKAAGIKFLREKGFEGMEENYYLKEDNTATINYAFRQDDVTMYPDLIKLKIALDNGEVVGMEARQYLMNHTEREIPEPAVSMEEARKKLNEDMEVYSSDWRTSPRITGRDLLLRIQESLMTGTLSYISTLLPARKRTSHDRQYAQRGAHHVTGHPPPCGSAATTE